jgi:DNA (cytosine-5)-methyltransferase 1
MKFIDLFAGVGGFHYGLSAVRPIQPNDTERSESNNNIENQSQQRECLDYFQCVYSNEWDKYANSVYRKHFGECDDRDIRTVPSSDIPDHDLLVGGFPCQAFSVAGKRAGFDDTRGTLFFEIARILRDKRPRYFILENVKGLLSHDSGKTFQTILRVLSDIGYGVQWQVLNSKDFGVPQNRERIFIIGHLRGTPRPQVFPIGSTNSKALSELTRGQSQGFRVYETSGISTTIASQAGGLGAKTGLYAVTVGYENEERKIGLKEVQEANTITATSHKGSNAANRNVAIPVLTPDRAEKRQNGRRFKTNGEPSFTLTSQDRHGVVVNRKEGVKKEVDIAGTLSSSDWRGLNRNQDQTAVIENMAIRRLTPIECERLQGFPDCWTATGADGEKISDTQRYKMMGNAVTTLVITEIGRKLIQTKEVNQI